MWLEWEESFLERELGGEKGGNEKMRKRKRIEREREKKIEEEDKQRTIKLRSNFQV